MSCSSDSSTLNESQKNQEQVEYYSSGEKKSQGVLVDDLKNGIWKDYDDQGNLVQVAYYYQNKKVTDLDVADFNLKNEQSSEGNFSMLLPSSWALKKDYKGALLLAVKQLPNDDVFSPTINVVKVDKPTDVSFNEFLALNIKDLQSSYDEFKVREENNIEVSEKRAYEIMYFVRVGDQKLGVLSTYYDLNQSSYIVTCIAEGKGEEFVKYKDLFKQLIRSVNFPN